MVGQPDSARSWGAGQPLASKLLAVAVLALAVALLLDRAVGVAAAVGAGTLVATAGILALTASLRRVARSGADLRRGAAATRDEVLQVAQALHACRDRLDELQERLARSERLAAFGTLGAGITHEVKNPITALVGFAQLAQRKIDDPEKVLELLRVIESEGLRCRDILSSFLKFARGSTRPAERLDLNRVVQETARVLRHQLAVNNVRLEVSLGEELPAVLGSATELQQVIVNLAVNAQQAMPEGGVVRIQTRRDTDGWAVVAVADSGPGIPREIQSRIFEPFFTTKPSGQGTGLGLAISANIAKSHGGVLRAESEPGAGATFSLRLPPVEDGAGAGAPPVPAATAAGDAPAHT